VVLTFNHLEKYWSMGRIIPHTMENKNISQLGVLFPIYGKIKFMFQTTNQYMYYILLIRNRKIVVSKFKSELFGNPCHIHGESGYS